MSHSEMLQSRRRKQRTRKDLAVAAKRAKKLGKQNVKMTGADVPKKRPATSQQLEPH
jgi:hypothetical protein